MERPHEPRKTPAGQPPTKAWLRYRADATHEGRRRLPSELTTEAGLEAWFGDDRGPLEVADRQAHTRELRELLPLLQRSLVTPEGKVMVLVVERWRDIVGAEWEAYCAPQTFRQGTLMVEVDDPAWQYRLQRQLPLLLQRARRVAPDIRQVRLVPGGRSLRRPGGSPG